MPTRFIEVADADHAAMLDAVFEEYCAQNSDLDWVELLDMQAIILALYLDGATTREALLAALAGDFETKTQE